MFGDDRIVLKKMHNPDEAQRLGLPPLDAQFVRQREATLEPAQRIRVVARRQIRCSERHEHVQSDVLVTCGLENLQRALPVFERGPGFSQIQVNSGNTCEAAAFPLGVAHRLKALVRLLELVQGVLILALAH